LTSKSRNASIKKAPAGLFLYKSKDLEKNMKRFIDYIKAVRAELIHVSWPSRNQAILYTLLVIAISLGVALILGGFDFLFTLGLEKLLQFKK
jgi:preprotein translocase subunit SecE